MKTKNLFSFVLLLSAHTTLQTAEQPSRPDASHLLEKAAADKQEPTVQDDYDREASHALCNAFMKTIDDNAPRQPSQQEDAQHHPTRGLFDAYIATINASAPKEPK